jgi:acetoacetate decarboxylase
MSENAIDRWIRAVSGDRRERHSAGQEELGSGYWSRLWQLMAPGDWLYRDAHYLSAEMEVDPRAAAPWLPKSLKLGNPPRASVFTAWFPINTFGSNYREAGVFLHVEHLGRPAIFCPWMIVDDDVALILGRELLGYPKKLGEITFEIQGDHIRGVAKRRGAELIRMEGALGERLADPPPMLGRPHRNVRASMGLALPKMLAFTPRERPIEVRQATLDVRIGGSERDPLHELGLGRVMSCHLHRVNLGSSGVPVPCAPVSPLWFIRQLLVRAH